MITITSLTHPTMIAKIRAALKSAALGQGHKHGGHNGRVYIANAKGHNIMRIDYKGASNGGFIAYGGADWGQTVVTDIVKAALARSNNMTLTPVYKGTKIMGYKARIVSTIGKLFGLGSIVVALASAPVYAEPIPLPATRIVQDNAMYAQIYAQCMGSKENPGIFFEESCRKAAQYGSETEVQWDNERKLWVRSVEL